MYKFQHTIDYSCIPITSRNFYVFIPDCNKPVYLEAKSDVPRFLPLFTSSDLIMQLGII